jgi:NADH dehydrogenase subunit H (EC 1.6.5.3)
MIPILIALAEAAGILLSVTLLAAALTFAERRLLGFWQDRLGPNRVGWEGTLQVAADMIKIFFKQDWTPPFADPIIFVAAPIIVMATVMLGFVVLPITPLIGIVPNMNIGLLFFLGMTSLSVYGVILAGWSSNSKFALLGGMRAAAQMVSYEVFMGLALIGVVMLTGSFSLEKIVDAQTHLWFVIPQFFGFLPFLIAGIAEAHRLPFDLPEGENELGAGFHTEYSSMKFGMFFVGEYASIVLISSITVVLYFGGWHRPVPAARPLVRPEDRLFHRLLHPAPRRPAAPALRPTDVLRLEADAAPLDRQSRDHRRADARRYRLRKTRHVHHQRHPHPLAHLPPSVPQDRDHPVPGATALSLAALPGPHRPHPRSGRRGTLRLLLPLRRGLPGRLHQPAENRRAR